MRISASFESVKRIFWAAINRGESKTCPLCLQHAKVYHRKLNYGHAQALILMHRLVGQDYIHVPTTAQLAQQGGEIARLRFWGLLEEEQTKRPDGGRSGWWRLTDQGVAFVKNQIKLPSHVWIYNNSLEGMDTDRMVSIVDLTGSRFHYDELMNDRKMRIVS